MSVPRVPRPLDARGCRYAIKLGCWSWLPLKQLAAERRLWHPLAPGVTEVRAPARHSAMERAAARDDLSQARPAPEPEELPARSVHARRRALRVLRRRYQPIPRARVVRVHGGLGAQEKSIAELKGEFALDVVPTRHYTGNCAWQQLSVLAYNVARSFQLDIIATPRPRSHKRTYAYVVRSMRTLRFLLIARAGRVTRVGGRQGERLAKNPATEAVYTRIQHALAA